MDNQPGSITLDPNANVMSYRALMDAAALADRRQQPDTAKRWRTQAQQLKTAWQQANQKGFPSFTNGLWPSGIAVSDTTAMTQVLQQQWDESTEATGTFKQTPPNLQAAIAQAHQWLFLQQPDRVWTTLKWFWQNQASPGLYTWGENPDQSGGMPMPKSFSQWQRLRGWVNPPHIT
ncbi:MAG: hypothetical protein HC940_06870, partial [Acaryochloris sp. SU_5_25]|nr:hypothetical protein [Acaryochloris sp. SU_5_25]